MILKKRGASWHLFFLQLKMRKCFSFVYLIPKHHPMKIFFRFLQLSILLTSILFAFPTEAQTVLSHAKNANPGQQEGVVYSLPRTTIKIDFIIEKNQRLKGPYSEFADKMLGISDVISSNEVQYSIVDAVITTLSEPDPEASFFLTFDEKSSRDGISTLVNLLPDGILSSYGIPDNGESNRVFIEKELINAPDQQRFTYYAERNLYQRIDTLVRKITIDTTVIRRNILQSSWVDRSPEQKARSAADFIQKIRESRFNLITGYQEINYGSSIAYMDNQLQKLESEYLSLFLGAENKRLIEQTIYFTPDSQADGFVTVAKFSEQNGVSGSEGRGENIQLQFIKSGNTSKIAGINANSIESVRINNSLIYRTPEIVDLNLSFKGKSITSVRLSINQLGVFLVAPITKTKMSFNPETGQLTSFSKE